MTDAVKRLNEAMFDIKDKTRINAELWNPLALAICDVTDEIDRLRNAIYEYAEHVLIMEGTDFISSIVDDDLKTLMENICHKDPAKE